MDIHSSFQTEQTARQCCDERYAAGYMEQADPEKAARIRQVLRNIDLPKNGNVLDYGCGSGALTAILEEELSGWTVYGTDLSPVALEKASRRMPGAAFELIEESESRHDFFDCIFTHHVLEHVQDIEKTFASFSRLAKKQSWLVHICPCGNPGSFEHALCLMRDDGIGPAGRFFFEDPAHLRRLSTQDIRVLGQRREFEIIDEYYANQHYGALDWISAYPSSFWREIFDTNKVDGLRNKARMFFFKNIAMPILARSKRAIQMLKFAAKREWRVSSKKQNGSEMYIVFKRG